MVTFLAEELIVSQDKETPETIAFICAYNAENILHNFIKKTLKKVDNCFVINDGSNDKTSEIINGLRTELITHINHRGFKACIETAAGYLSDKKFGYAIFILANNEFDPNDIPKMVEHAIKTNADFVCANRNIIKKEASFYNKLYHKTIYNIFNGKFFDIESQFCMFSKDALNSFMTYNNKALSYFEIILKLYKKQLTFQSINVNYKNIEKDHTNFINSIKKCIKLLWLAIKFTVS